MLKVEIILQNATDTGLALLVLSYNHGLRTPNAMKPFFIENPELLGLGRQIGQINSGAFRTFLAKLKTDRK